MGCTTIGPDYKTPDLSGQHHANWIDRSQRGKTTSLSASAPATGWWRQFDDVELERLVGKLLASNLDLAQAHQRIVEARARRGILNADNLPQVDLEAAVRTVGTGENALNFQGPSPGEAVDVYSAGALAGWELDLWGRVGRLTEAADRDIDAQYGDYGHAMVSLHRGTGSRLCGGTRLGSTASLVRSESWVARKIHATKSAATASRIRNGACRHASAAAPRPNPGKAARSGSGQGGSGAPNRRFNRGTAHGWSHRTGQFSRATRDDWHRTACGFDYPPGRCPPGRNAICGGRGPHRGGGKESSLPCYLG